MHLLRKMSQETACENCPSLDNIPTWNENQSPYLGPSQRLRTCNHQVVIPDTGRADPPYPCPSQSLRTCNHQAVIPDTGRADPPYPCPSQSLRTCNHQAVIPDTGRADPRTGRTYNMTKKTVYQLTTFPIRQNRQTKPSWKASTSSHIPNVCETTPTKEEEH